MRYAIVLAAAACGAAMAQDPTARALDEVGRITSVMLDGDVCRRIVTPRALEYEAAQRPRDPGAAGDNYDVDDQAFTQTKKMLIRLSRLVSFPCDVNLWMPFERRPGKIQAVIRNANELSQFWRFGASLQDVTPQMKSVLETGRRATVERPGIVSVLAPVFDSLGDVVGLAEVVTRRVPDAHENVK